MPQVTEFPPVGTDPRSTQTTLVRIAKDITPKGEPFREFRSRLRAARLWDKDRPVVMLRFLGVGGATIQPSIFLQALASAPGDDEVAVAVLDRLWHLNGLLGKTVLDLVAQRSYGKDEIYKHLGSASYRGTLPSRPSFENWLQLALAMGLLRQLGIAVAPGPRADRYLTLAGELDVDEFLAEDRPEPEPVIPTIGDDDAAPAEVVAEGSSAVPAAATAAAAAAPLLPAPLRHLSPDGVPSPRGRDRVVPVARFAAGFDDDVLADTARKIAAWSSETSRPSQAYRPEDFGLDSEKWVEGADEVVYRLAVAAALAFRLERDRASVVAAFGALDRAGVLTDLYHGTVPEELPAQVDARALMLASLAARRCAEVPELAASLEGRASAAEAFAALDGALGRGLFRIELFWILDMLAKLGVVRYDDLGDVTATPYRLVRDTLFRLGFLDSPYASDPTSLARAARAARRAAGPGAADEVLVTFALAAGCGYDCAHRRTCDFPCRERLE
jgi:hypothetical protein